MQTRPIQRPLPGPAGFQERGGLVEVVPFCVVRRLRNVLMSAAGIVDDARGKWNLYVSNWLHHFPS